MIARGIRLYNSGWLRLQSCIGSRAGNLVQGVRDGTDKLFHAFTGNGGNGMKFEAAPLTEIAQRFQPGAVRRSIELGGNHNHGFSGKRFTEGRKLAMDDFEGMDRVIGV